MSPIEFSLNPMKTTLNERKKCGPPRLSVQLNQRRSPRVERCDPSDQTQASDCRRKRQPTKLRFLTRAVLVLLSLSVPPTIALSRPRIQQRTIGHLQSKLYFSPHCQHSPTTFRRSTPPARSQPSVNRKRKSCGRHSKAENCVEAMIEPINRGAVYSSMHLRMQVGTVPIHLLYPRLSIEPGIPVSYYPAFRGKNLQ